MAVMRAETPRQREATLRDFAAVCFRRKWVIFAVLAAAIATVFILSATTVPAFQSAARLLISRGEPESVYNTRTKLLSWEEELASEMEVLRSSTLGERAQKILAQSRAVDSRGQPVTFRPEAVAATTSGKASVLVVTYTGDDAIGSREALRALTRAYIEWRGEERNLPVVQAFFQEELEALRDRLADWEQRRADFMTEEGIVNIPTQRESLLRQREDASYSLTQVRARLADMAARLEAVRRLQQERELNPEVEIYGLGDADFNDEGLLFNLRKELVTRRAEYFDKRARFSDNHPEVQGARDLVEHLERQLDIEVENYVRFLEARMDVLQARVASLQATMRGMEDELSGLPDKAARLAQYDRIIEALQTDYSTVVERQVTAKVERSGRQEWRVILLQPAQAAAQMRTRDYIRLTLVPLFALLIGLALAFVLDGLDHSVKDATEAEDHLRVPVLGSLSRSR
jgi:uncharacterized protein involved in exopolysaccharide biosynthesis